MSGKSILFSKSLMRPAAPATIMGATSFAQEDAGRASPRNKNSTGSMREFATGESAAARDGVFAHRVNIQQFIRANEALLPALADGDGVFGQMVSLANKIADVAMTEFGINQELSRSDAGVFRQICAQIVEKHRKDGHVDKIDIDAYGRRIARLLSTISANCSAQSAKLENVSQDAALTMSSLSAVSTLYPAVMLFSFYLPAGRVLNDLSIAITNEVGRALGVLLPAGAPASDVRNMSQTLLRTFSSIMAALYERKARDFVGSRETVAVAEGGAHKEALDDIIVSFASIAKEYVALAERQAERLSATLSA